MENNQLMIDTRDIEVTASVHQVTKFRVFELAYEEWHGVPASESVIEAHFVAYLFDGVVPCWVRAYTRNTLRLCEAAGMQLPEPVSREHEVVVLSMTEIVLGIAGLAFLSLTYMHLIL